MDEDFTLSDLIATAQGLLEAHGDLKVVSGIDRTGWGEALSHLAVVTVKAINEDGKATDDETVVDLVFSVNSTHAEAANLS
jgi:hypothetical protein